MPDIDGFKPWQQMAGETSRQYHAFTHFIGLLPFERSMDRAYTNHQLICKKRTLPNPQKLLGCSPEWNDYRFKFSWVERAQAHDAAVAERERELKLVELDKMNKRHIAMAQQLQSVVVTRLNLLVQSNVGTTLTPPEMAKVLREATAIERRARDVATVISKTEGQEAAQGRALDLAKLSDEQLKVFEELVRIATPTEVVVK